MDDVSVDGPRRVQSRAGRINDECSLESLKLIEDIHPSPLAFQAVHTGIRNDRSQKPHGVDCNAIVGDQLIPNSQDCHIHAASPPIVNTREQMTDGTERVL
jgi:hypothetical protein